MNKTSIAFLLTNQGQLVPARELCALACRYPRFRNSALYKRIACRKIRTLTAGISPDDLDKIAQYAVTSDIWQEATSLLDNLLVAGWEKNNQQPTKNRKGLIGI